MEAITLSTGSGGFRRSVVMFHFGFFSLFATLDFAIVLARAKHKKHALHSARRQINSQKVETCLQRGMSRAVKTDVLVGVTV